MFIYQKVTDKRTGDKVKKILWVEDAPPKADGNEPLVGAADEPATEPSAEPTDAPPLNAPPKADKKGKK